MSVSQDLLHVTKYEVLGKLPDLFTFEDGTPVSTPADWPRRRSELYKTAVELQYGTMPPKPEFLEVETLFIGARNHSYRIHTGTREKPVSFLMKLVLPASGRNFPVIVDGDMCFPYHMDRAYLSASDAFLSSDEVENFFTFAELLGVDEDDAQAILDVFIDEEEDLIIEE
jgi:hypothetical protein